MAKYNQEKPPRIIISDKIRKEVKMVVTITEATPQEIPRTYR